VSVDVWCTVLCIVMQCVAVCVAVCVAGPVASILPADGGHAIRRGRQVEGGRHELLDLGRMDSAIARRRRGSRVPSHVAAPHSMNSHRQASGIVTHYAIFTSTSQFHTISHTIPHSHTSACQEKLEAPDMVN